MRKSSKEHKVDSMLRERAFQAELESMIKGPPVTTFSAQMPAYTYTGLCPDPRLRKPPGKRKPEEWECPNCYWDTTSDEMFENAVLHDQHGGFYDWEAAAVWTCPVCGCKFETWESN